MAGCAGPCVGKQNLGWLHLAADTICVPDCWVSLLQWYSLKIDMGLKTHMPVSVPTVSSTAPPPLPCNHWSHLAPSRHSNKEPRQPRLCPSIYTQRRRPANCSSFASQRASPHHCPLAPPRSWAVVWQQSRLFTPNYQPNPFVNQAHSRSIIWA